jgi:quinolinate synthase
MKMITLPKVRDALLDETGAYEVKVPEDIAEKARIPIERMISITP